MGRKIFGALAVLAMAGMLLQGCAPSDSNATQNTATTDVTTTPPDGGSESDAPDTTTTDSTSTTTTSSGSETALDVPAGFPDIVPVDQAKWYTTRGLRVPLFAGPGEEYDAVALMPSYAAFRLAEADPSGEWLAVIWDRYICGHAPGSYQQRLDQKCWSASSAGWIDAALISESLLQEYDRDSVVAPAPDHNSKRMPWLSGVLPPAEGFGVSLRYGPGEEYPEIARMMSGAEVYWLGYQPVAGIDDSVPFGWYGWYYVSREGCEGWIAPGSLEGLPV
ncbi:MAG: hypothetical protein LBH11_01805 [Propionibacteriaceae bacterium]|nr:hypothetical protein [Propionibacteriaceae bacterium]